MIDIVAMVCIAGMSQFDCGPMPGFSRSVATVGQASSDFECTLAGQMDAAKSAVFQNLAPGEFIKIMCVHR